MKNHSRILALVLTVILAACLFALPVMAEETGSSALELTLTTDKAEYTADENITATLTVKNTAESAIGNLVAQHIIPDGYSVVNGTSQKAIESLAAGESVSLSVTYGASNPKTGDYTVAAVAAVMIASAAGLIALAVTDGKARKGIISMFLCCILVAGLAVGVNADELTDGVTVSTTIKVDGKEVTLTASVCQTEKHTYDYTSEAGDALTVSNLLPEDFAGSDAVKAVASNGVYTFAVAEPGTYDLCLELSMADSLHRYGKITVDAGTAAETSFVLDYEVAEDKLAELSNNGTSYLTGCSVDLSAGTHTITVSAGKTGAETAQVSNVYVLANDTSADYVVKSGDTWYTDFGTAVTDANALSEDVEITFYADFSTGVTVAFQTGSNNIVVNGNGHTFTSWATDNTNNQTFTLNKPAGEVTIKNLYIEHNARKFVFRIDSPAVVNLVDVTINADTTSDQMNGEGLIYFKEWSDINLNMVRVDIHFAVTKVANSDSGTGTKGGVICTGYDNNDKTKTVNISMEDSKIDATEAPTYAGICVMRGVTVNLTMKNSTILTGREYAIMSRSRSNLAGRAIANVTLSGTCVLKATNDSYNQENGYSYGGGSAENCDGSDCITITVK